MQAVNGNPPASITGVTASRVRKGRWAWF